MQNLQNNSYEVSSEVPDWSREKKKLFSWEPSKSLMKSIRDFQRYEGSNNIYSMFLKHCAVIRHRFWSVVTGADIPITCKIGGGLLLPHPNGIVIHPNVVIGPNCLIFQQVTIGSRNYNDPCIGGHVDIGAGAKIIGNVKIGNHALIGANAVVLEDVPERKTAVGIPAKVIN